MFLKKMHSKNHTYLSLVETYREGEKIKHKTLLQLGRLDQLEASNQLSRLVESFERLIQQKKRIHIDDFEELDRVNWGANKVFRKLWNDFGFESIFKNIFSDKKVEYSISETTFFEVVSRLVEPCSKLRLHQTQSKYFGIEEAKLHHLYRVLDLLSDHKEDLENAIFRNNVDLFNVSVDVVFYDVTTLYFESQKQNDLKDFGYGKDGKFNEVQIVLGLLVNSDGLPVGFDVFSGNTFEGKTLLSSLKKLKERFNIKNVIIVADRGINSKINLKLIKDSGFDYIVGSRLKSLSKKLKIDVRDKSNYHPITFRNEGDMLRYSFDYKNLVQYEDDSLVDRKELLDEKLHCTWSKKRANKDKKDRLRLLEKARKMIESGKDGSSKKGAKKYISGTTEKQNLCLDEVKILEDESWDGFYGIQCSKLDLTTDEVLDAYHRLWKIEESFRILKSTLQTRPMFHWSEKRIKGHLVVCFIAFLLQRMLELRLIEQSCEHSPDRIRAAVDELELSIVQIEGQEMYLRSKIPALAADILRILKIPTPKSLTLPKDF
ncbi:MAG: IS1634 family transposase [Myxococcaceae bacterium]